MGYGRSLLWGAAAGLVAVVLAVVGFVALVPSLRSPMSVPGDRVLIVIGSKSGNDGSQVAQLVGIADLRGEGLTLTLVDPMLKVAVPGTTYDRLRDAYPFGGGGGVARALASARHEQPLPVVTVSQDALVSLVDGAAGIRAAVPTATNVFDGTRMFTFAPGEQQLSGADVVALLSSQDYLASAPERAALEASIASGLARALADRAPSAETTGVTSSLGKEDLAAVAARLRAALSRAEVRPFAE